MLELDEIKQYLRVDYEDDDQLLVQMIESSKRLCADIARVDINELSTFPIAKIAMMYAIAYLFEHREEADYHQLTLSLRSILEGIRRSAF